MKGYSDHSTMGGQILSHRVRMMGQNWLILFMIGKLAFVISFISILIIKYGIHDIWNYLCVWKAECVVKFNLIDEFSKSCLWFNGNIKKYVSDYDLVNNAVLTQSMDRFKEFLIDDVIWSTYISLMIVIIVIVFSKYFGKNLSDGKTLISGSNYIRVKEFKKHIKNKSDISLGGVPYPKNTESRHTIITGTTGSGKTTVFHELIRQVIAKKERAVIVDTVGTLVDNYFDNDRDIILNSLDLRSVSWSLIEECGNNQVLLKQLANCFITSKSQTETFWDNAAKIVFSEVLKKIAINHQLEDKIFKMLQCSSVEWQQMLKDSVGSSLMDKDAEKMALSIRATLISDLDCLQYLKLQSNKLFSINRWIDSGHGILFLSCTPEQRPIMIPLISSWLTIAAEAMLHTSPTDKRTWFFIDEFHNLRRLPRFETYLAEIRKFGGCFVIGTQMVSQLNAIYTSDVAKTIVGLCGTKVIMNIPELSTAKYMSGFLGKKEELSVQETISYGANSFKDGSSLSQRKEKGEVVTPTEIMDLKIGEAFIRFSGMSLIGKVQFEYKEVNINPLL